MKKLGKGSVEKICLVENQCYYLFDGKQLNSVEKDQCKSAKETIAGCFVSPAHLTSFSAKLPLTIEEEAFASEAELKLYESGTIDPNGLYAIGYVRELLGDASYWHTEIFAIEEEKLHSLCASALKQLTYIDYIAIPYLAYSALYATHLREAKGVELFIHLGREYAFIALYVDGNIVTFRDLPSIETIAKRLGVGSEALEETLATKGLDSRLYQEDERGFRLTLEEMMDDVVHRIETTVKNRLGAIGREQIDRIILDFHGVGIPALWELFEKRGFEQTAKEVLSLSDRVEGREQFTYIKALYLYAAANGQMTSVANLSLFQRPPPLLETIVGRLLAGVLVAVVLLVGLGAYLSYSTQQAEEALASVKARYTKIDTIKKASLKQIASLKKSLKATQAKQRTMAQAIDNWAHTTQEIGEIVGEATYRRKMMRDVNTALRTYKLKSDLIEAKGASEMTVRIISTFNARGTIAQFMQRLKALGYRDVHTKQITRSDDLYHSQVEIRR